MIFAVTITTISLWMHIAAGTIALFVAPIAMIVKKGGDRHRLWGKVYFWAMFGVAVTAILLAVLDAQTFLFLVAIFSFYLSLSGYRILYRKKANALIPLFDKISAGVTLIASLGLVAYGIFMLSRGIDFGWVAIAFGSLGSFFAGEDVYRIFKPSTDKRYWWYYHMGRMLGAYIATVSAFSAVNMTFLPTLVQWLWPSVIGTIGIIVWTNYYRRKFTPKQKMTASVTESA